MPLLKHLRAQNNRFVGRLPSIVGLITSTGAPDFACDVSGQVYDGVSLALCREASYTACGTLIPSTFNFEPILTASLRENLW
jgi:hypothetical protein